LQLRGHNENAEARANGANEELADPVHFNLSKKAGSSFNLEIPISQIWKKVHKARTLQSNYTKSLRFGGILPYCEFKRVPVRYVPNQ
jgi:hypothetical protein